MANNIQDDVRRFVLEINESRNNGETLSQINKLQKETSKLRTENEELQKVMGYLAAQGKKNTDEYKRMEAQYKANRKVITQNNTEMKGLSKTLDLNYMSMGMLKKRALELRSALSATVKAADPEEYNRLEKELRDVNAQMGRLKGQSNQTKGALGNILGVAKGLLPAFSFTAILYGLKQVLGGLFNLTKTIQGETIRSVTVLGDEFGYVEEQAGKLARKMGVTNREFISMVANTADLLVPLDFSRKKAAEMASQVQGLSGALDEWTAGKYGVAEVSEILTKAMLGEMEQLKGLGIAIRQDSEEFRNLVKQKKDDENATDAQARALATLELIYKKSGDAQAAYEKSGNKLLRIQKSVTLWWKNMKESAATYLATTANDRMLKQVDNLKKIESQFNSESRTLDRLLVTYDGLKSKGELTKDEQLKLNNAIRDIGNIVPTAITEFNKYGDAIGINKDKIVEAREAQRLLNLEMKDDIINDLVKSISNNQGRIEDAQKYNQRIGDLLKNEALLKQAASLTGKTQQEVEEDYILGIAKSNELIGQRNSEMAQSILKLKEIGLTQEEISSKTGIAVTELDDVVAHYLKTIKKSTQENEDAVEVAGSLIDAKLAELDLAKKMPETTEAEIAAKNKKIEAIEKEIKRLKELGVAKEKTESSEALDKAHQQQILAIRQFYADREHLQKEENARLLAADLAYLQAKAALETDEVKKLSIQSQIILKQREYNAALKEAVPEIINTDDAIEKFNSRLLEQGKLLDWAATKRAQATADQDELIARQRQQAQTYQMISDTMVGYISDALNGSLDEYASFGDAMILMSLQILKQMAPIWAAQIIGGSLATPQSIMTGGIAGIAQFTALLAIMEGAIALAEKSVNKGIADKRDAAQRRSGVRGYATGGYTDGDRIYRAGEEGIEWIANAQTVRENRPFFELLNAAQRNGTVRDLAAGVMGRRALENSGSQTSQAGSNVVPVAPSTDPELKQMLAAVYGLFSELKEDGIQAYFRTYGANSLDEELEKREKFKAKVFKS